jgi:hypothetical protein
MRRIAKVALGTMLLIVLGIVGCKKKPCYNCYGFFGYIIASKNADTIGSGTVYSWTEYHDSIERYLGLGYKIDTAQSFYFQGVTVCDTNSVYHGQPARDSCVEII